MRHNSPPSTRRGSALKGISIGCVGVLLLLVGILALTFGYFGPGLPRQDYQLVYEQHAQTQSGLDATQAGRTRQIWHELGTILDNDIYPLLVTDSITLGGTEVNDADLPADQVTAIEAVGVAMETSGVNSRIDELIALGAAFDGGSSTMRSLARLLGGQFILAWRANEAEGAARAYLRLRGLAAATAHGSPSILGRLVAVAMDVMAASSVTRLLTERTANAELIRAVYDAHMQAPDRNDWLDLKTVLEGERILAREMLGDAGFNIPIRAVNPGAADQDFGRLNEHALAAWRLSGHERIETIRQGSDDWIKGMTPMASMIVPAYEGFLGAEISSLAHARATRVAMAIELHHARTGSLPASLDALVPEYLAEMPLDPCTEEPFRYTLEAESPVGYRLYTIGFDGVDNQGAISDPQYHAMHFLAKDNDQSFMPAEPNDD